jgi:3-phosphoinositide dependent protein kinase-1
MASSDSKLLGCRYVKTERDILNRLAHSPAVTDLYSTFQSNLELYYVMELCPNGELYTQIERYTKQGGVPYEYAKWWAAELVLAMGEIFAHGVIHRDIKPDNILLSYDNHIKLCDFGTAKFVGAPASAVAAVASGAPGRRGRGAQPSVSFVGSADYVSPELLADEPQEASAASDLWALGCVIYHLIAGQVGARSYHVSGVC